VTDIEGGEALDLGDLDIGFLAGGFTGNFIGLDVIDMNRRNASSALFSDFEYRPQHTHK
jgi:xylan 1,4-beta-xylosidase